MEGGGYHLTGPKELSQVKAKDIMHVDLRPSLRKWRKLLDNTSLETLEV